MSLRTIALLSGIVCLPGMAAAQAPAAPAPEATAAATNCTKPDEGADMNTVISRAVSCVGWIKQPPAADGRGTGLVADVARAPSHPGRSSVLSVAASTTGVSEAANELFSLIVQIAVDKAKREGLAMLHDELARAVCDLKIPLTKLDPATNLPPLQLNETCKLITDTDLQALLGQGAALRAALTADLVGAAQAVAADKLAPFPPLAQGGQAGIALIKRVIADPNSHLTLNDVWLVAEPVLNTGWQDIKDDDLKKLNPNLDLAKIKQAIAAIQYSLASARVYLQAQAWTDGSIDLAVVVRQVLKKCTDTPNACDLIDTAVGAPANSISPAARTLIVNWTNLALTMVNGSSPSQQTEDFRVRLRALAQLVLESLDTITNGDLAPGKRAPIPGWVKTIVLAALDTDAPHLISTLADTAAQAVGSSCTDASCVQQRKVTALLTGISTYAITYTAPPAGLDSGQLAAWQQQQQDARKQALESVIDAATDRRGRAHQWVTSMGVGVGYAHSFKISDLKDTVGKEQLHVPLGVALQWLPGSTKAPGKFGIGFHAMGTALDLGNYVHSTNASTTKVDWKAIVAPGIQAGVAIGKPNNFFVVGAMFSYSPQFVNTTINNTTTPYSATKYGLFVHYYFSLWDLN